MADSLASLALAYTYQGETTQAEALARESVDMRRELGDQVSLGRGLQHLGHVLMGCGKFAESRSSLAESLAIQSRLGYRAGMADATMMLGLASFHLGEYDSGCDWAQTSLELSRELHYLPGVGRALAAKGACTKVKRAYAESLALFQEGARVLRAIGQRDELSWALAGCACSELALGRRRRARRHLAQALHIAAGLRSWLSLYWTLPSVSVFLATQGRAERALEVLAPWSRALAFTHSRGVQDLIRHQSAAAFAALPPDVAAAARERGQALDPATTMAELLIELDVARALPGPLGRLGRPLARLLRPLLALVVRRRA
jgi:tetratricopeptide (TPR) repeat protein